mgnify:CR=1 FL=1
MNVYLHYNAKQVLYMNAIAWPHSMEYDISASGVLMSCLSGFGVPMQTTRGEGDIVCASRMHHRLYTPTYNLDPISSLSCDGRTF